MPAEYRIDVELATVLSRASRRLTDNDLLDHQRRLKEDPRATPSVRARAGRSSSLRKPRMGCCVCFRS